MFYSWAAGQLILECHVQPGARSEGFAGLHGGRLKIRVATPPVDGKANERLIAYLAAAFGVPKSQVSLLQGASSRHKRVGITDPAVLPSELGISWP